MPVVTWIGRILGHVIARRQLALPERPTLVSWQRQPAAAGRPAKRLTSLNVQGGQVKDPWRPGQRTPTTPRRHRPARQRRQSHLRPLQRTHPPRRGLAPRPQRHPQWIPGRESRQLPPCGRREQGKRSSSPRAVRATAGATPRFTSATATGSHSTRRQRRREPAKAGTSSSAGVRARLLLRVYGGRSRSAGARPFRAR